MRIWIAEEKPEFVCFTSQGWAECKFSLFHTVLEKTRDSAAIAWTDDHFSHFDDHLSLQLQLHQAASTSEASL